MASDIRSVWHKPYSYTTKKGKTINVAGHYEHPPLGKPKVKKPKKARRPLKHFL